MKHEAKTSSLSMYIILGLYTLQCRYLKLYLPGANPMSAVYNAMSSLVRFEN
jgi:hypothetical protein